ncbi:MAG: hypothetical protein KGI57_07220 [Hyphomicrobiales bacterium]|nr:hypothetical protein [Hyphomicrobiales bacterium]
MSGAAIQATVALLGEDAVLIRGPSGAGKTRLALVLVARRRATGGHGAIVGDDRVVATAAGGRLVATPHPGNAGLVERRGVGIVREEAAPAGIVRLVVDLVDAATLSARRLPGEGETTAGIAGVALPCIALSAGGDLAGHAEFVEAALARARAGDQPAQAF